MLSSPLVQIFIMLGGAFILGYMWRGMAGDNKAQPTIKVTSNEPDNLEVIDGIAEKTAEALNNAGIYTFRQLAATDVARLKQILADEGMKKVDPSTWPAQAARLRR